MNKNILKNKKLSKQKCPLCKHSKWKFFIKRKDSVSIYKCSFCSLYISEEFWKEKSHDYEKEYFKKEGVKETPKGYIKYEATPEFEFFWQFALLKLFTPKAKRILDLGSGTGKFLEILRIEGLQGKGIDISRFASKIAKEKGLKTTILNLEKDNILSGRYDVVTAWDLIEHLKNPLQFLEKVNKTLNKNDSFILTTPCADRKEKKWFNHSLEHKIYFTEKSLLFLIKKVFNKPHDNFELIKINFGGRKSGCFSSFVFILQKEKKINKKIIALIKKRKLSGKEEIDNYLRTIFIHFFKDSEKGRFFKTKDYWEKLFYFSLKHHSKKWHPADLHLFKYHNPYFKSYKIASLEKLYQLKETEIYRLNKKISEYSLKLNTINQKLNSIYQSKTWRLLKSYQVFEKKLKNFNKIFFWQNFILKLKTNLIAVLKPINFKKAHTFDLFYFPIIDWHFRFQRSQQICTQLAKNGHRIFYLKPTPQVTSDKNLNKNQIAEKVRIIKIASNIFEITPVAFSQFNIYKDSLSPLDKKYLTWSLEAAKEKMQIRNNLAMVALPFWYSLVKNEKWQIIYDCMDEHSGFSNMSKNVLKQEKKLIKKADLVISSSQKLFNKNKKLNPNHLLVRNAGDFNHFSKNPKKKPADLKLIKSPIIGYYGAISDWFDEKLIEYLALKRPKWQFVFIGHVMRAKIDRLKKLPNVHFLGERPYQELTSYLYQFDCFIIPFKLNKLILATNPVKAYEVLSSGKPIVSVNLPELQPMKNLLYLAKTKKDFLKKIEKALKEKSLSLINQRIKFAKQNTWDKRTKDVIKRIKKYVYPKVSVVVISYNTLVYLKKCLKSIYQHSHYPNLELIVVDNGSKDKTADYLRRLKDKSASWRTSLKIILFKKNLGFAGGNNAGIKKANGEYIILLNSDTIVTKNWIIKLLNHLKKDSKVGLVGPVSNCVGNEAKIDLEYKNLKQMHKEAEKYTKKDKRKGFAIPMLGFFCAAGKKALFDKIGPLDKQFKAGFFEDDDYCRRVKLAGFKLLCAADVFIHHFGNKSFEKLSLAKKKMIFETNKKKFEKKWGIRWSSHKYRKI